jgi:hypothetical protein
VFMPVGVPTWLLLSHCPATAVVCRAIAWQQLLCSCLFCSHCLATGLHATILFHLSLERLGKFQNESLSKTEFKPNAIHYRSRLHQPQGQEFPYLLIKPDELHRPVIQPEAIHISWMKTKTSSTAEVINTYGTRSSLNDWQ